MYRIAAILTTICLVIGSSASAQDDAPMMVKSQSGVVLDDNVDLDMCVPEGVAVGGYDLVSYRLPDGPALGSRSFAAEYDGSTYLFVNQMNLDWFLDEPQSFLPAYSGFCAITLALGRVTCPDYGNFQIENDQLLLFEVTGFTNGRTLWNSDSVGFRRQADDNFERLIELQ